MWPPSQHEVCYFQGSRKPPATEGSFPTLQPVCADARRAAAGTPEKGVSPAFKASCSGVRAAPGPAAGSLPSGVSGTRRSCSQNAPGPGQRTHHCSKRPSCVRLVTFSTPAGVSMVTPKKRKEPQTRSQGPGHSERKSPGTRGPEMGSIQPPIPSGPRPLLSSAEQTEGTSA